MSDRLGIRPIYWADALTLYEWRRDPVASRFSTRPIPLNIEQHLHWMDQQLAVPRAERTRWMFEDYRAGLTVATASLSPDTDGTPIVSLTVGPHFRRMGYGTGVLQHLQQKAPVLRAYIMVGNTASLKLFARCGFELTGRTTDTHVVMEWRTEA